MNVPKYRKARVYFKDIEAGLLEEYEKGFRFTYREDFKKKGIIKIFQLFMMMKEISGSPRLMILFHRNWSSRGRKTWPFP
jgi:hypothetical protein